MVDIERVLLELESIPNAPQVALQGRGGDWSDGCGRLETGLESDFTLFNFDLPYINSIIEEQGMFRTRVMRQAPKTCYTYHRDPTMRKHIPIITNDNCMLIVDDEVIRLEAGKIHIVDTTKMHTALNASTEERIHIVGCCS